MLAHADHQVLNWLEQCVSEISQGSGQCTLLLNALVGLKCAVYSARQQGGGANLIDLPFAVAQAEGSTVSPIALAGACCLVFLALDIFDDLADGDCQEHWKGWPAGQMNLAAATLLSAVVPLIMSQLPVPADVGRNMQKALAQGLMRMSAGQQSDLAAIGQADIDPAAVEASVVGKSGEQQATYGELAGLFFGAPDERVQALAEIGRCLGTAGQLASDCYDILGDPAMRDLANGARTLPIALCLHRSNEEERARFIGLLEAARLDPEARAAAREFLKGKGVFRWVALRTEVYGQRARRMAVEGWPDQRCRAPLEALIMRTSEAHETR